LNYVKWYMTSLEKNSRLLPGKGSGNGKKKEWIP